MKWPSIYTHIRLYTYTVYIYIYIFAQTNQTSPTILHNQSQSISINAKSICRFHEELAFAEAPRKQNQLTNHPRKLQLWWWKQRGRLRGRRYSNRLPRPFRDRTISVCFRKPFRGRGFHFRGPNLVLSPSNFLAWRFLTPLNWKEGIAFT